MVAALTRVASIAGLGMRLVHREDTATVSPAA